MKKRKIFLIVVICICILVGIAYLIDLSKMKNNEEVIFSTWGKNYVALTNLEIPKLLVYTNDLNKAECLYGTYSLKKTSKNGKTVWIQADSMHPTEFEYKENNKLKIEENDKIYLDNEDVNIKNVKIYRLEENDEMLSVLEWDNIEKTITLSNVSTGEYVLEINTNYNEGNVCYGVRVNIVK